MRTALPRLGATEASTRLPARSRPPGVPASSVSNSRSSPVRPTGAPAGTPRRSSSAARSGGAGPTRPAISDASAPRSESRASPSASGVPSRAWIAARGGSSVSRLSFSPGRRPGWTRSGPQSIAAPSGCSTTGSASAPVIVPNKRVRRLTGTVTVPSAAGSPARPVVTDASVATLAALRYALEKRRCGIRS